MMTVEFERIKPKQGNDISGYCVHPHSDRKTDRFESSGFRAIRNERRFGFDRLKQKTPKRIPLINRNDRVIYAHVGDQFSVGTGLYEIIHYDPHRRWRHPHGIEPAVVCKLIAGNLIPDFEDMSGKLIEGTKVVTTVTLCVKTLSQHYVIDQKHRVTSSRK